MHLCPPSLSLIAPPRPALGPGDHAELERIEHLLCSLESTFDRASQLAELGAMTPLFAHEVNNLMTQVAGRAQLALMRPDDPALVKRALELAHRSSEQIARLAEFFLEGSCHAAHGPRSRAVRVAHEHALGFVPDEDIASFGFKLIEDEPGVTARILPALLEQVLLNLYLNAARAVRQRPDALSGAHAVRVLVERVECSTRNNSERGDPSRADCSTWNSLASPAAVRIVVEDTGVGMEPKQVDELFSTDYSPAANGHGIGLAVCRRMLSQAGGSIDCESIPGQGTRMIIALPGGTGESSGASDEPRLRPAA